MDLVPDFSLRGKLALVTGATQGLGWVIARAFAAQGARIIINGRHAARVQARVDDLNRQGHQAFPFVFDIGNVQDQAAAFGTLSENVGVPDILVNNVGIRIRKPMSEVSLDDIMLMLNVNLMAAVHLSKLSADAMVGARKAGRLITLTSIAGELARAGDAIYPVAKQGLSGLIRALAVEYGPHGITSNGIAPGTFATESNAELAQDPIKGPIVVGRNPLGRWARPEEIAGPAVFLASPGASYVNGHILVVDGGFSVTF
ncbi:SDR family oxidoreductase [Parapusillimonas sp. SGNA-6]|nr:SDR family oxidoreductase [Parapusillimonas sp. SGNA-6]